MKKILQVLSNHPSYDNIRIINPLLHIRDQLKSENIVVSLIPIDKLNLEIAQQFDVICVHGCLSLAAYSILRKIKFCLWVDDLMVNLPPSNPANPSPMELDGLRWCYQNAQSVVCTTQWLANHIGRGFVCPNLIDLERKINSSENVLYSYGNSHTGDLELLRSLTPRRDTYFFGHTLPSKFCHYYRNPKGLVELKPNNPLVHYVPIQMDYERYGVWMNNLNYGVGLIPLEDNVFNLAKSDLKVLEYLQHGAISVCSNVGAVGNIPDECVVKVNDNWDEAIEHAFDNRSNIYNNAYDWAMDNRSYEKQSELWMEAYRGM